MVKDRMNYMYFLCASAPPGALRGIIVSEAYKPFSFLSLA
jgi:hypothetical protein